MQLYQDVCKFSLSKTEGKLISNIASLHTKNFHANTPHDSGDCKYARFFFSKLAGKCKSNYNYKLTYEAIHARFTIHRAMRGVYGNVGEESGHEKTDCKSNRLVR